MTTLAAAQRYANRDLARESLYFFTRFMFKRMRGYKWIRSWHQEEICDALMRVFRGESKRLIINVPPRYSKTEIAVVNFIAWALGRVPDSEFIHVSYSADLAENNSLNAQGVMLHEAYAEIFDTQLSSTARGHWTTTAGGVVRATGNTGTLTGFGAGKMRDGFGGCFPYDQLVDTEIGPVAIGDIVTAGADLKVWSYNEATGQRELQRIARHWRNPANDIIKVTMSDGSTFRCTPDHEVLTAAGWTSARHLAQPLHLMNAQAGQRDGLLAGQSAIGSDLHRVFGWLWACVPISVRQRIRNAFPCLAGLDLPDDARAEPVTDSEIGRAVAALEYLNNLFAREFCAGPTFQYRECTVPQSVLHVVGLSAVREITQRVVSGVAVQVPHLVPVGAFTYELLSDQVRDVAQRYLAADGEINAEIPLPVGRRLKRSNGECPADVAKVGHLVKPAGIADSFPVFVEYDRHVEQTFCLEVERNNNFTLSQSGAIVSNCIIIDDPHKPNEAESDKVRQNVIEWFKNTLQSRTNSPDTPIIVIMQRLHEADLSGWLLAGENGEAWDHLCLPAYDDADYGALWPWKHEREKLAEMEKANPYVFAGQYMQRPAPLGGGILKSAWWGWYNPLARPRFIRIVQSWDTAYKAKETNDYSVCTTWGETATGFYLLDMLKERMETPMLRRAMVSQAAKWKPNAILIEDKASGQSLIQDLRADTRLPVIPIQVTQDKIARAQLVAPIIESGRVYLPEGHPEMASFVVSASQFPNAAHDDDVDSVTQALAYLNRAQILQKPKVGGL